MSDSGPGSAPDGSPAPASAAPGAASPAAGDPGDGPPAAGDPSDASPAAGLAGAPAPGSAAGRLRDEFTNLPNLLTLGRIALIPAILGLMDNYSAVRSFFACLLYIAAALTDLIDGWLARRRQQVSILGQLLDPLADKLLVTGVLVYMAAMGRCEAWLVVALLARELVIQGLRSIASSEGLVISASQQGKQKTALQMVGTMFLLIHFKYPVLGLHREVDFHAVGIWTLRAALVVSVVSAIGYVRLFVATVYGAGELSAASPRDGAGQDHGADDEL